jgi:branched-chain amino acid transport system substrate-binding protein
MNSLKTLSGIGITAGKFKTAGVSHMWPQLKRLASVIMVVVAIMHLSGRGLATEPIHIGLSLGLTGQFQQPAAMQKRAYELWRDEVNARGGMMGRNVELVIRDDNGDPELAKKIYTEFVTSGSVDHLFAPYSSQLTAAVAPIADAAGFPMLAAGAAADDIWRQDYHNIFGILTPASRYTQGMLRLAHEAGLTTVAILHSDDPFSEEIANGTRTWAPYLKLKVLVDVGFSRDATDLTNVVRQARAAGVDLLVVAGYFKEAVHAHQALTKLGWMPRAFFATIGPALSDWKNMFGNSADHTFATSLWESNDSFSYPQSKEFAAAFSSRYGMEASYQAAAAYAAGQILEAAIESSKSIEHDAVRAAIFDLDTYTVLGRFAVDRTGMQVKRLDMIIQWQNGRKEIVWPDAIHTSSPIFGKAVQ